MVIPTIQRLKGQPDHFPIGDLQTAIAGTEVGATATTWEFASGPTGSRIVFTGNFDIVGGNVVFGTVTGFELYDGVVKVMTGSGYDLSVGDILKAHDAAIADDYTIFYATFFNVIRDVGSAETDHMYGSAVSGKFFGEGGDDFMYGGPGNEVMKGGLGDDWVEGRGKQDKLFGNEGADTFAFTNADENNYPGTGFAVHRVKDFDPNEDRIFLDVGRFTAIDPGPLDLAEFGTGRKAKTPDQNFVFRKQTGDLFYDEDGKGGVKKVLIAEFEPGLKLKAHHFEADFVA